MVPLALLLLTCAFLPTGQLVDPTPTGIDCLRLTSPGLNLTYPADAESHFEHIHAALYNWTQPPGHRPHTAVGFKGPWIENVWITHFRSRLCGNNPSPGTADGLALPKGRLKAVFGPFIPLFITWVDVWVPRFRYPPDFRSRLLALLRPDVAYVTVSQNDEGLQGKWEISMRRIPNILVFSSGGYGHVPVPLYAKNLSLNNHKYMAVGCCRGLGGLAFLMPTVVDQSPLLVGCPVMAGKGPACQLCGFPSMHVCGP